MKHPARNLALCAGVLVALVVAACGGGGGGGYSGSAPPAADVSGASAGATSSGTISAFGSVFVNGHEFATGSATIHDDDAGTRSTDMASLEVGMSVDVRASSRSSARSPEANEIHLHRLARGPVDAADASASTVTVLGQTVQLTASTNYSDHRACVAAASAPCPAVTGQSGLVATTGSGAAAVAGSQVTVYGYLFDAGTPAASSNIVATLVVVDDAPSSTTGVNYQVEGLVTATSASGITIGGLTVDLSGASCRVRGATTPCAAAFSVGQVVSAFSAAAPALPASTLAASGARLRGKLVVETAGATVELEGKVASVSTTPAGFVLRGLTVNTSGLSGATPPGVGDVVRVLGTVAADGQSVTASSVTVLHLARSATYGFEGDASAVAAGPIADTWVLTLLGQDVTVSAGTRLSDRSVRGRRSDHSATNPFNITSFKDYLAASASQHLLVRTQVDTAGKLQALSVTIAPASVVSSVGGVVDATPAPAPSSAAGVPTTFSLHGLAVSADPAAVVMRRISLVATPLAAGDFVLVRGSFAAGTLSVAAPTGPIRQSASNIVIDFGPPLHDDHDCF
jgi:hypothetical protein